jgi:ribosomal protein S18 acetylase RimI-like enzyme
MKIRKLSIANYEDMVDLWSRTELPFKPKGRDSREAVSKEIKSHPDFFLGAFEDGRLIGTAIISCDVRRGWINRLAVDAAYRNRGIAKALISESERILRKNGMRLFCALIETSNIASQELFEKSGYVKHRDIVYFSKRDSDDV